MPKVNFYLSLFFLLPLFAFSQKAAFQLYTTDDGLSRNTIWGITQDRQDFLWLATDDGFNRFDGHHFLNHNNSDDPVFTKVRKTGNLIVNGDFLYYWENGQLEALNTINGSETTIYLREKIPGNHKDWKGITLNMNSGGIVLAVLYEKKKIVYVVRVRDAEIQQIDSIPNFTNHIFHYAVDDRDNLFYLNNHGISKIDHQGVVKQMLAFPPGEMGDMLQSGQGNKMFVHLQDKLWVWEEGMTELQLHPVNQLLDYSYIFDVLETSNGDLWISGSQRHLFNYDASTHQLYDFEPELKNLFLNPVDLINIFQDVSGTIWLESVLGLLKVVPQRSLFDTYYSKRCDACSGHCSFRGFAEDREGAIYAGFYANICKIGESGADDPKPLLQHSHTPFEILFDDGKLILNDGYVFDPLSKVKSNPYRSPGFSFDIGLLEKDEQERVWWAWGRDLYFLEKQTGRPFWKQVDIGNWSHDLTVMRYDPTRHWMWLGNSKRLVAINTTTKELVADAAIEEQQFSGVHCIYIDAIGKLWIGAETGLVFYDPANEFWKKFTQADGLPNEFVHGIQPEGDFCLWLATNKGLSRFSIATKEFINFYEEDGLLDNEFNRGSSFTASDGKMYFGGIRGFIAFYPADVMTKYQRQKASGNILLHAISIIDEERDTVITDYFHPDEPMLDIFYNNKAVTFEFGLVDHQSTGATQYRYKLDGYNHTWSNPSPNNRVTFSSLPSGDYTFRVEALNAKGQWLPDELAVQLVVHPPWWATNSAFFLYALVVVGIAYGIFRF